MSSFVWHSRHTKELIFCRFTGHAAEYRWALSVRQAAVRTAHSCPALSRRKSGTTAGKSGMSRRLSGQKYTKSGEIARKQTIIRLSGNPPRRMGSDVLGSKLGGSLRFRKGGNRAVGVSGVRHRSRPCRRSRRPGCRRRSVRRRRSRRDFRIRRTWSRRRSRRWRTGNNSQAGDRWTGEAGETGEAGDRRP